MNHQTVSYSQLFDLPKYSSITPPQSQVAAKRTGGQKRPREISSKAISAPGDGPRNMFADDEKLYKVGFVEWNPYCVLDLARSSLRRTLWRFWQAHSFGELRMDVAGARERSSWTNEGVAQGDDGRGEGRAECGEDWTAQDDDQDYGMYSNPLQ